MHNKVYVVPSVGRWCLLFVFEIFCSILFFSGRAGIKCSLRVLAEGPGFITWFSREEEIVAVLYKFTTLH